MRNLACPNIVILFVTLSVLATAGCRSDKGNTVKAQLSFYQLSFHLDDIVQNNTPWGSMDLVSTSVPNHPILYFNLSVGKTHVIQNMPLLNSAVNGTPNKLWVHFPLGVPNGKKVDTIKYGYKLSTTPINTPPTVTLSASVMPYTVMMGSGKLCESWKNVATPGIDWIWNLIDDWADHPRDKIVNQDCGRLACFPAAISNSLKLLKKLHPKKLDNLTDDANNDRDDTDIKKVIQNIDYRQPYFLCMIDGEEYWSGGPNGATTTVDPKAPWNQKKKWLDGDPKYPIETTIIDDFSQLDKVLKGLKDKCDVELLMPLHAVMITGMIKLKDGTYLFEYVDDTQQGKPGGTKTSYLSYNSKTKTFFGNPLFEGDKYEGPNKSEPLFMIECPK